MRSATVKRKTKETDIAVTVGLDGTGKADIATKIGFFDHMIEQVARHSLIDISLKAKGDLHIDQHHTVEDVGIALGMALHGTGLAKEAAHLVTGLTRNFGPDLDITLNAQLAGITVTAIGGPFVEILVEFESTGSSPDLIITDPDDGDAVVLEGDIQFGEFKQFIIKLK